VTTTHDERQIEGPVRIKGGLIDCDVHHALPNAAALKPYLATKWHEQYGRLAGRRHDPIMLGVRPAPDIFRRDTHPPEGGTPGSSLELMREQYLDPFNVTHAILNPLDLLGWPTAGAFAGELIHALNDWTVAEWFEQDDRLYGTISVAIEDPLRAAAEIRTRAGDPRWVGVMMTILTRDPIGHAKYLPLFEAAAEQNLPVIIHVGGFIGVKQAAGFPSYWVEHHTNFAQAFVAQAASLACSTLFDDFPNLEVVLEEGGIGWMPSLMWRLDRAWRMLPKDAPNRDRKPSELMRQRFWLTTQPMDEPPTTTELNELFEQLDMDDKILFASDYPHWDYDDPIRVFPASIGAKRRDGFLRENAQRLFDFGADD
jgi:predicted TIM-barrel fold metal-dependent hydrolase